MQIAGHDHVKGRSKGRGFQAVLFFILRSYVVQTTKLLFRIH